jgi:hypothetical protein
MSTVSLPEVAFAGDFIGNVARALDSSKDDVQLWALAEKLSALIRDVIPVAVAARQDCRQLQELFAQKKKIALPVDFSERAAEFAKDLALLDRLRGRMAAQTHPARDLFLKDFDVLLAEARTLVGEIDKVTNCVDQAKPEVITIPPLAYLRAMFNLGWSAFRHPFKTTVVDLMTGRIIESY